MKRIPIKWDDVELERAIQGRLTVFRGDEWVPYRLSIVYRQRFEEAKAKGYLAFHNHIPEALANAWWTWCEMHERPYFKVGLGKKTCSIDMDLIACPYKVNEDGGRRWQQWVCDVTHARAGFIMTGGICLGAQRVLIEKLEEAVALLLELAQTARSKKQTD